MRGARKLYRNTIGLELFTQLVGVLIVNGVHSQSTRAFKIERAVVNEQALRGRALGDSQREAENQFLGFARMHITGAEKNLEVLMELEGGDAVLVELERLVVYGADEIFSGAG